MGSFRVRRSKSFGPVRVTVSKRGVSTSIGKGPLRITKRADGRVTSTVRAPGTGISYVSTSGSSAKRPVRQTSKPTPAAHPPKQVIGDAQWQALLTRDETAPALTYQRDFVRIAVRRATGVKPSLRHLTVGQAERILAAVNADVAQLYKSGRNSPSITKVATIGKWVTLGLVVLLATFAVPGGLVIALGIIAGLIISGVRRRARQEWEDNLLGT
jgi:hypothetical protein